MPVSQQPQQPATVRSTVTMAKKRPPPEDEDGGVVDENRENGGREDAEDDGEGRRQRKKKRGGGRKVRIMARSGQTEADRRVLRRRQRDLKDDIAMGTAGKDAGGDDDEELRRLRGRNNELWDDVRYTREAVLDSENVDLLANKAARQAEKMVQVPRYDAIRLAQALVKKGTIRSGSSSQFNWHGLGFQVGVCFNALPSHASFLYGPLDAEYTPKERKKPERRKRQTQEEEESENEEDQPEDITQEKKDKDGNELSAVEKHIKVIRRTLHDRAGEKREEAQERAREYETQLTQEIDDAREVQKRTKKFVREQSQVCAVNCLFNPRSFTQTVENVFHYSFLLKEGFSGIRARGTEDAEEYGAMPGPVIRPVRDGVDPGTPRQAIVSLTMKDWRDMCAAYNVEASDVPHREQGKVGKKEKKRKSN